MDQSEQGPSGGVTAHLTIRGGKATDAIDFYSRAFGAEEVGRHMAEDGERIMHAHLKINGGSLMLNDEFPEFMSAPTTPPGSLVCTSRCRTPTQHGRRPWPLVPRSASRWPINSGATVTGRCKTRSASPGRSARRAGRPDYQGILPPS